ncbi:MAG: PAS domain S-box protein [Bacteroidales bacterium]|nr:PAS domain S-box protein [Bacteroidales bacterium]
MEVKEKFLNNNFLTFIFGLDLFYVVVFFVFYLLNLGNELTLNSVLDSAMNYPALILILLHPFIFILVFYLNSRESKHYVDSLKKILTENNEKIEQVYEFVEQLREGQTAKLQFSDSLQQDKLIRSLLNLRDELDKARSEEEFRKKEEQQRHWTNEGLANFGAILRENVDNLNKLSSEITSNLTKYLNSQQAGFFIINDNNGEKTFEMLSLFAFERKKFPDKKLNWGEGLIGASAIEQKTIFIKDTSNSFVDITSGLGKANPRSILIVPIKDNEGTVHGVLELASFKVFEKFEINFVEQVAESIGLTMATIKTSLRTQELLKESQKQAEMLAQQEETMRRNIEEIERERQDADDKFRALQIFSEAVDHSILHIDINTDGEISFVNDNVLQIFDYQRENLIGSEFCVLMPQTDKEWFEKIWKEMIEQHKRQIMELKLIDSKNKTVWVVCSFFPVMSDEKTVEKISMLAVDFSDKQEIINDDRQRLSALVNFLYKADFNLKGGFISISDNFKEILNIDEEIENFNILDLYHESEKEQFSVIWANITKGRKYKSSKKIIGKNNTEIELEFLFTPIFDINNQIVKVDFIAIDVTENQNIKKDLKNLKSEFENNSKKLEELSSAAQKQINKVKSDTAQKYDEKVEALNLYKHLFENMTEAVVLLKNNSIVVFNSSAENLWGYKKDIIIGKKLKYLFPANDEIKKSENYLFNVIENDKIVDGVFIADKEMKIIEVKPSIQKFKADNDDFLAIILKIE